MKKEITIESYGKTYHCTVYARTYLNTNSPAIMLDYYDEECKCNLPYATLTVNIPGISDESNIVLDTNNVPNAKAIIDELNIGFDTLATCTSGYGTYPIYGLYDSESFTLEHDGWTDTVRWYYYQTELCSVITGEVLYNFNWLSDYAQRIVDYSDSIDTLKSFIDDYAKSFYENWTSHVDEFDLEDKEAYHKESMIYDEDMRMLDNFVKAQHAIELDPSIIINKVTVLCDETDAI